MDTLADFWRMVWQTDARAIVMVSGLVEKGVDKVTRYWPKCLYNHDLKVGDATLGEFKVKLL